MRGLEGASELLAGFFRERLPGKVDELVARLGVPTNPDEDDALYPPRPATEDDPDGGYFPGPRRLEPEDYPAVMLDPVATVGVRLVDNGIDDVADSYLVRYRLRVFVLVRGETYADTHNRRARLTLAARELILSRRSFDDPAGRYVEGTLVESYSDVEPDENGRTFAGAYLELELELEETLDPRPEDAAHTATSVLVSTLPHHPALD